MARVTSKLQVTLPKALADQYGIAPGDDIEWEAAGDYIRVTPSASPPALDREARLRIFDQATARQKARDKARAAARTGERGWTREELYQRGRPR
ncbi:MAG TPA: AbrB/MazE/SpoVT family DNA-binding domain-containing protein [Vicinamibacterales bacterium]|nr:AbrB/MazE/SpoVT family DNA-binding domain-containing protein [Vicinamibacterales bacterium]